MSKKKIFLVLFILFFLLTSTFLFIFYYSYSNGVRSGRLVKLSKKGYLYRTYEGTLDLGSGDKLTWDFSIRNDNLGDGLIEHAGKVVRLRYKEHLFELFYNTPFNVVSWELIENSENQFYWLCRFVNILRIDPSLVEKLRRIVEERDLSLLQEIRKCQKNDQK